MTSRPIHKILFSFVAVLLVVAHLPAHAGVVIYVDSSATAPGNGLSWPTAYTDLQSALAAAASGDSIWVAKGTYYPAGSDRTATFQLVNGVALYGGFAGTETGLSERDWATNVTTLSGDIGTVGDWTDNSYHVVTSLGNAPSTTVLDGFTVTGGRASGTLVDGNGTGGGMVLGGSPTIRNVVFSGNRASIWGAGVYEYYGSPSLTNVAFFDNHCDGSGGGMLNFGGAPRLVNVTFSGNSAAGSGAGFGNSYYGSPTLVNVVIWGNTGSGLESGGSTTISYSLIQGSGGSGGGWNTSIGTDGGHNIDIDPLFVDPGNGDFRLPLGSPAANAGNSAEVPGGVTTDLDGSPRVVGTAVDMGAYETACPSGPVLYVRKGAGGANDGTSWVDAFKSFRSALGWGACGGVAEIWVASGTYKPTSGLDRAATFQLVNGVTVYGGFAGTETSVSQRNSVANPTILSGDINDPGTKTDNTWHVLTGTGTNSTAVLDGFTVTKAYAVSGAAYGGGMLNSPGSPTIANVTFLDNEAGSGGGGMSNRFGAHPTLTNVVFSNNVSYENGGGMENYQGSNPTLTDVTFTANSANNHGGGMYDSEGSSPTVINATFSGNSAYHSGGGMYNYNGCNPTVINAVFVNNETETYGHGGAGMGNNTSTPSLVNVTFAQNDAGSGSGGGIANYQSDAKLVNTILWGNTSGSGYGEINNNESEPEVSYSLIEGGLTPGCNDLGNNIDQDPRFVDVLAGNVRLIPVSPAVDAGANDSIPVGVTTDLDGNPRIVSGTVDMGAYESQAPCPPDSILYVDQDATGADDGTSWGDAFPRLEYALDWVMFCPNVREIWVAEGTYMPTDGADRAATFELRSGVGVYGGFDGTEMDRSLRDWRTNLTVLSGDIGTPADSTDNCYHVVTASGTDATAVLDGFTITDGNADASPIMAALSPSERYGDGDAKPSVSGTPIVGSRSIAAYVDTHGGGIYNNGGSPTLANLIFSDNFALDGGGMYNDSGSPTLTNVTFKGNRGLWGGGLHNYDGGDLTLVNAVFWADSADFGGAMYNNWSNPELVNVTVSNSGAYRGGGMYNNLSDPVLVNTILWGDTAEAGGHEIYNLESTPQISYSLIAGSGGSGGWDTGLGMDGGENKDADPLFWDGTTGDLHLYPGSPAIDAGANDSIPAGVTTDLDGSPRIAAGTVDMGAYESQATLCPPGPTLYVDENVAGGANDGSSWANAFTDLQDALLHHTCPGITEIWVAAGTYKPTSGPDRMATFELVNGIAIYGGFAGGESSVSERDWATNVSTLSGDIGTPLDEADNSYHVVTGSGTDSTAVLDGFTVTQGYADGAGDDNGGAGMITVGGSPTIVNVIFTDNDAEFGGGMHNRTGSTPTLTNVTFSGNSADHGAGMRNDGASHATLINVIFSGNSAASHAGGMHNDHGSNPTLTNVVFWGNSAVNEAGGMFNGVGSNPTLTNVTFSQNSANYGGGILNWDNSNPMLVNTILWGNSASTAGDEIHNLTDSAPVISYSLIEGSGGSSSWDTSLGTDGGNNIDVDPLLVDAATGNLRLIPVSPAVDAGINGSIPSGVDTDLAGNPRIAGGTVDMGAYEFQALCPPDSVLYVDASATGAKDGRSWADALPELRYALEWAPSCPAVKEIWVVGGTYKPTADAARDSTFHLSNNMAVYGGFAGTETSRSQRDWNANVTTLSGDIGSADVDTDNSYHVITGSGADSTAVLDGFTITKGYANGGGDDNIGGGLTSTSGSPTLSNLIFLDNFADDYGGGMADNQDSHPTLINVAFHGNTVGWSSGGGGGMLNSQDSHPTLANVTFSENVVSGYGGAIFNYQSNPKLVNAILWGNTDSQGYPEIYNSGGADPKISYSVIAGSGGSAGWDGGLGTDGGNNIDADPLFVDAGGADLRLLPGSPAINAGANDSIPSGVTTDLGGNPRVVNGTVDMGAYEFQATCPPDTILYVDTDATGANDGTSWTDAFQELRYALEWVSFCPSVTEIWVAEGTYYPTSGAERDTTLHLVSGVGIYGGFAGTEPSRSQRDWSANVTTLSGDIGVVDTDPDNSYHVVTGSGTDSTAVLDGFVITGGYADSAGGWPGTYGGGMLNVSGSPTVTNVTFAGNYAKDSGGGMYNYENSNATVTNVVFVGNWTTTSGHGGGGMANNLSTPSLVNVTFAQNDTENGVGGAMANYLSDLRLVNTIMWGNTSGGGYDEIYNNTSVPRISYSLIDGSGGSSSWDTNVGFDLGGNIDDDPLFVDALAGDLHLSEGSPAIDAGANDSIPSGVTRDLDGNPRIAAGTVDMGAYEYQAVVSATAHPSPLVFAQVPGNQTTCDTLYVVNNGDGACTIAGIAGCDVAPFSMDTALTAHLLAPGDSTVIVVCVTPTAADADTTEVTVVSDAWNSPLTVQVRIDLVTAVGEDHTPKPFRIVSVAPNPFNPSTTVHFTLPAAMPVTAVIYSVTGARVRVLAREERFEAGDNRLVWNGRTDRGTTAASGVYFIRLETLLGARVARAVLLK